MQVQCSRCPKWVTRAPWQLDRARRTFCSSECRWLYYSEQKIARAWATVDRDGPIPQSHPEFGACWLHPGKPTPSGYVPITARMGKMAPAHRAALEAKVGPLPAGFFACHTCDVRNCVRNDEEGVYQVNGLVRVRWGHLFVGTRADNMADMKEKGRKGSSWSPENAHLAARGARHGRAKLTEDQVREIRRRYAEGGIRYAELGAEYGVHAGTVGGIVTRKEWVHVP